MRRSNVAAAFVALLALVVVSCGPQIHQRASATPKGSLFMPLPAAVILDTQTLTTQVTLTTKAWGANVWSRIEIELIGLANAGTPANAAITIQANADNTAKYGGSMGYWNSAFAAAQDTVGTATSAQIAEINTTNTSGIGGIITLFPKTVSGRFRSGYSVFQSVWNNATVAGYWRSNGGFTWTDTATDWTFSTITFPSGSTFTGTMIVRGYP